MVDSVRLPPDRSRPEEVPDGQRPSHLQWVIDITVAAATGAAIAVTTSAAATTPPATAAAYVLGVLLGALLLARRRWPVGVLVGSMVLVLAYNATDFASVSPIWPLLIPLFTVARAGQLLIACAVGSSALLIAIGWIAWSERLLTEALAGGLRDAVLLALVLALGTAMRNRQLWTAELRARLRAEQEQRDRQASQRMLEERLEVARELHDVTAHGLAVVSIQLGLAQELARDDPEATLEALEAARQVNLEAIGELAAAVRALRGHDHPQPDLAPAPGTAQLPLLLERAADSGLATELVTDGDPRPVPPAVSLTLFRIAQESITNVLRHSDATAVRAELRHEADGIGLTISDNGSPAGAGAPEPGHGLTGMRERTNHLGGWFSAGAEPGGGFGVRAWFPWSADLPQRAHLTAREGVQANGHSSVAR